MSSRGADYHEYTRNIRHEYQHLSTSQFSSGRGKFLESMLERDHIYRTNLFPVSVCLLSFFFFCSILHWLTGTAPAHRVETSVPRTTCFASCGSSNPESG